MHFSTCSMHNYSSIKTKRGPVWLNELGRTSLSPIRRGFAPDFVSYKKGFTRLADVSDKVYQLLAHGR